MYIIISSSKTQDFERKIVLSRWVSELVGVLEWNEQTKQLSKIMKKLSTEELGKLMKISPKLAQLNFECFQSWDGEYNKSKILYAPAIVAFLGDVYKGFDLDNWNTNDYIYANKHLGIISGFYGLISPLNYIQPYRLEMGTRLSFSVYENKGLDSKLKEHKNLYTFWSEILTRKMTKILKKEQVLINLVSIEYSKVIDRKRIKESMSGKIQLIDVNFKISKINKKTGRREEKIIAIYAKRARGIMSNWIIKTKPKTPKDLENFKEGGWKFKKWEDANASVNEQILFIKII